MRGNAHAAPAALAPLPCSLGSVMMKQNRLDWVVGEFKATTTCAPAPRRRQQVRMYFYAIILEMVETLITCTWFNTSILYQKAATIYSAPACTVYARILS